MRSILTAMAIALPALLPIPASAQDIEAAAVRAILSRGNVPTDRQLALEPRIARPGHAPAVFSAMREPARTAAIARALRADTGSLSDLQSQRGKSGAANRIIIALSDPSVHDGVAMITVTATYAARRGNLEYESVAFTLRYLDGAWVVVAAEQLGVS